MPVRDDTVSREVEEVILAVLRERMGPFGFKDATIRAGQDHDGDPVLFVDVHYDLVETPLDPTATFGLITEVRDALDALGETRFPHILHDFPDEQAISRPKRKRTRV